MQPSLDPNLLEDAPAGAPAALCCAGGKTTNARVYALCRVRLRVDPGPNFSAASALLVVYCRLHAVEPLDLACVDVNLSSSTGAVIQPDK